MCDAEKRERVSFMSVPSSKGLRSSGGQTGMAEYCIAHDLVACRGSHSSDHWNARHLDADTLPALSLFHLHMAWYTENSRKRGELNEWLWEERFLSMEKKY